VRIGGGLQSYSLAALGLAILNLKILLPECYLFVILYEHINFPPYFDPKLIYLKFLLFFRIKN
jgi:hypothetical protein